MAASGVGAYGGGGEWGASAGAAPGSDSVKQRLVTLIHAVRTLLRSRRERAPGTWKLELTRSHVVRFIGIVCRQFRSLLSTHWSLCTS